MKLCLHDFAVPVGLPEIQRWNKWHVFLFALRTTVVNKKLCCTIIINMINIINIIFLKKLSFFFCSVLKCKNTVFHYTILCCSVKYNVQTTWQLGTSSIFAPSPPPAASGETAAVHDVYNGGLPLPAVSCWLDTRSSWSWLGWLPLCNYCWDI